MIIRDAEMQDFEQVLELAQEFTTSFVIDPLVFEESYGKIINSQDTFFAVAESSKKILAYLMAFQHRTFFANGYVTWIEEVMVRKDCRRQGIGRQLIQSCEKWASSQESRLIVLATRRANAFYQALDYVESATYLRKIL